MGFFAAPIIAGADKLFFERLVDWTQYLWPGFPHLLNVTPERFMYGVGAVEIAAGVLVLLAPRIGSLLVAGWLAAITTNLVILGVTTGKYGDIALRDFGLMLGAITLFLLATAHSRRRTA